MRIAGVTHSLMRNVLHHASISPAASDVTVARFNNFTKESKS
jgi:hypothetical protein